MPLNEVRDANSEASGQDWLDDYRFGLRVSEQGRIVSIGDGVAWIKGLPSAGMDEIVEFAEGSRGLVFHLARDRIAAILLDQDQRVSAGTAARLSGQRLAVPAGDALLGRVVDPLGKPLDGGPAPRCTEQRDLDAPSPPLFLRDFVQRPLYTGNKIIDTLIPIGKGQRQLIIGDNGVGKTSLALDAAINQRGQDTLCVYVLIGQKRASVVAAIETLRETRALEHTAVVVAEATAMPGLKYLAPFAGCAIAEGWMRQGRDTLVVYDDLTTHARTYRELSLLLRRPPGREAYPGDIFYLHSRLLERATCLAAAHGGGSLTALPIVETEQGEIASYIPTNLISITDGQIYMDQRLFGAGILPAIDVTRSVSRIGGAAQHPRLRDEAGRMKLDYLQFLELEVFTRFGSRLEASMEAKIKRGRVLREILKQDRLSPLPVEHQVAWLIAFNQGWLDEVDLSGISSSLQSLFSRVAQTGLTLAESRDRWVDALSGWPSGRVGA